MGLGQLDQLEVATQLVVVDGCLVLLGYASQAGHLRDQLLNS